MPLSFTLTISFTLTPPMNKAHKRIDHTCGWLKGTGEWISGVETVMSVHLKTRHQPRTSALVNRSDAVHGHVVLTHTSHVVISSGQAGHARALTTSPGGLRSLKTDW